MRTFVQNGATIAMRLPKGHFEHRCMWSVWGPRERYTCLKYGLGVHGHPSLPPFGRLFPIPSRGRFLFLSPVRLVFLPIFLWLVFSLPLHVVGVCVPPLVVGFPLTHPWLVYSVLSSLHGWFSPSSRLVSIASSVSSSVSVDVLTGLRCKFNLFCVLNGFNHRVSLQANSQFDTLDLHTRRTVEHVVMVTERGRNI